MKIARTLLTAAIVSAAAFGAHAQDQPVTVQVHSGSVMVSNGDEFVAAANGAQLAPGSRIMLGEDSSASLLYSDGCAQAISVPGVHSVPVACQAVGQATAGQAAMAQTGAGQSTAVGAGAATGTNWAAAGMLFAGTAVVAAGLSQMGDGDPVPPPPPVSR